MKLRMRTNLGSIDADRHGLCHADCVSGKTIVVNDTVANWLLSRGMADAEAEEARDVKAIPKADAVPVPTPVAAKQNSPKASK